jgi:hypothetical protein
MNDAPSREQDEELLLWLSLRAAGLTWARVAELAGRPSQRARIAAALLDVRNADIKTANFWGDDPATVAEHYRGQT